MRGICDCQISSTEQEGELYTLLHYNSKSCCGRERKTNTREEEQEGTTTSSSSPHTCWTGFDFFTVGAALQPAPLLSFLIPAPIVTPVCRVEIPKRASCLHHNRGDRSDQSRMYVERAGTLARATHTHTHKPACLYAT